MPRRRPPKSTRPWSPSTITRAPVVSAVVPSPVPITAGMPYSRATIAACDASPPWSTTTAAARVNSGVQAGLVAGQTSTSPGCRSPNSAGPRMTRTAPAARPPPPAAPVTRASASSRRGYRVVVAISGDPASRCQAALRRSTLARRAAPPDGVAPGSGSACSSGQARNHTSSAVSISCAAASRRPASSTAWRTGGIARLRSKWVSSRT